MSRVGRQGERQTMSRSLHKLARVIGPSWTTGMIYRAGLVACVKWILGNARVVQWLIQDIFSLALRTPGKPGWPVDELPLVSDVNVIAFAGMTWPPPQPKLGSNKSCDSREEITLFTRVFLSHGGVVAAEKEGMKWKMTFFKFDCSQVLHFSRNQKPHSVLWLEDVLNYFNYLMVPPYTAHRIVS